MQVNFHPSSLLSIGDLLAFAREVTATANGTASQQQQQAAQQPELLTTGLTVEDWRSSYAGAGNSSAAAAVASASAPRASAVAAGPSPQPAQDMQRWRQMQQQQPQVPSRRPQVEAAPSIEQQMALAEGVTSRIPQR
jgi:hypothetical protein